MQLRGIIPKAVLPKELEFTKQLALDSTTLSPLLIISKNKDECEKYAIHFCSMN
jgi:hypothetical protein